MYPNQAVINEHLDENVSIGDNDSFMEIFGGSLNEEVDQYHSKSGHDVDETLDAPLQAPNANDYSNARLIEELENKNARVSGFRDQDVSTLQKILDQEFEIEKESIIKNVREKREQAAKQAGLQRKRMLLEKHLREEISEIEKDHRIEFWLTLIKKNSTPHSGRIEANSITARALAKVLWTNTSLTNLDLSRNGIDDQAGAYMARLLKRNTALKTICLGSNELGPVACRAFGDALCSNSTLRSLNLESNHLTCHGTNMSGLRVLADMFRKNKTLTSINMWRCALGEEAGEALSQGIESNQSITFLELGHNSLSMVDEHSIKTALDMNFKRFEELQMRRKNEQEMVDIISAKEKALQDQLRVERQLREWYMEQKQLRAEERREKEEKRFAEQVAQEEEAKRLLQERLEEEKKAEAARLSKKKKGNKKKKKGNKR